MVTDTLRGGRADTSTITADAVGYVRSRDVCGKLGITGRQLDWLSRTTTLRNHVRHIKGRSGSGYNRRWPVDIVRRLEVAVALGNAALIRHNGHVTTSLLPVAVEAVLDGPEPPDEGWVLLTPQGGVRYSDHWVDGDGHERGMGFIEPGVIALVPKP